MDHTAQSRHTTTCNFSKVHTATAVKRLKTYPVSDEMESNPKSCDDLLVRLLGKSLSQRQNNFFGPKLRRVPYHSVGDSRLGSSSRYS